MAVLPELGMRIAELGLWTIFWAYYRDFHPEITKGFALFITPGRPLKQFELYDSRVSSSLAVSFPQQSKKLRNLEFFKMSYSLFSFKGWLVGHCKVTFILFSYGQMVLFFFFSSHSLLSVFLVDSSIIPLYIIKFLYSACHCAQAVLCSVTSNSFPSQTPHPDSSLKLLAEAFALSAPPYVYKLEISSLCLPSKAICCLRPVHELVYSCG